MLSDLSRMAVSLRIDYAAETVDQLMAAATDIAGHVFSKENSCHDRFVLFLRPDGKVPTARLVILREKSFLRIHLEMSFVRGIVDDSAEIANEDFINSFMGELKDDLSR